jgi:hypothetical protein
LEVVTVPAPVPRPAPTQHLTAWHDAFLSILPRIELHGQFAFRGVRCPQQRADHVAEMVALCWLWFVRLVERGKDPLGFPVVLASYAARQVRCGRGLCGQEKGQDALSGLAQRRHGFVVGRLPHATATTHDRLGAVGGQRTQDALEELLHDNGRTPVPEQVAFRLDFPAWRRTHARRTRRLMHDMMLGERTRELARKYGLSPGRISQLRPELHNDWRRFCGEPVA